MALITKIRHRAGLAVAMVAIGLILFLVGGDILGPNSFIMGNRNLYVGEIAGVKIKRDEFLLEVEEMKNNYMLNFNRTPNESEMYTIRQQAWDYLIVRYAFQEQFDKIGISVTEDEVVDMVQGNNISPEIRQAFTNPETGIFDREQVVNYLQNINQLPVQQQAVWYMFERNLQPSRLRMKYDNLLLSTNYVTEAEAANQYDYENSVAEIKYLYIPYYTVTDSVDVTESMIKDYLNNHKDEYKVQESRSIAYVTFPVTSSMEDSIEIRNEMDKIATELTIISDDSVYASANSEGMVPYAGYNAAQMPERLRDQFETLTKGEIIGPVIQNNSYVIYKISDIREDTADFARASHILIKPEDGSEASKNKARADALEILNKVRGGADFAMTARQSSNDPSSTAGGDLGWFSRQEMVKPFSDAVFSASQPGLIPRVIESDFGFHIIRVTKTRTNRLVFISTIEKEISASDYTTNEVYRQADLFLGKVSNYNDFIREAAVDSIKVSVSENLGRSDRRITGFGDAREIVSWAYNTASEGQVSDIFEIDNNYLIAVLTRVNEEGTSQLNDIREEIIQKVTNDLKAEIILNKLTGMTGKVNEIANSYGEDSRVYTFSDLRLTTNTLPNVGFVPKTVGAAFSLNDGEVSSPVKENDGIVIVEMTAMTKAPVIADYTAFRNLLKQRRSNMTSYLLSETVKKFSEIEDNRYKFF